MSGWEKVPSRKPRSSDSRMSPTNTQQTKRSVHTKNTTRPTSQAPKAGLVRVPSPRATQLEPSYQRANQIDVTHSEGTQFEQPFLKAVQVGAVTTKAAQTGAGSSKAALTQSPPKDPRTHRRPMERRIRDPKPRAPSSRDSSSDTQRDSSVYSDSSAANTDTTTRRSRAYHSQSEYNMRAPSMPLKTTPKRSPKSLLEQNYLIVARLAKAQLLDEDLLKAMAKHLQDKSRDLEAAGMADTPITAEEAAAIERAGVAPILIPPPLGGREQRTSQRERRPSANACR